MGGLSCPGRRSGSARVVLRLFLFVDGQLAVGDVDPEAAVGLQAAVEQHAGEPVVHLALDRTAQRACAVLGLVAALCEPFDSSQGDVDGDVLGAEAGVWSRPAACW